MNRPATSRARDWSSCGRNSRTVTVGPPQTEPARAAPHRMLPLTVLVGGIDVHHHFEAFLRRWASFVAEYGDPDPLAWCHGVVRRRAGWLIGLGPGDVSERPARCALVIVTEE